MKTPIFTVGYVGDSFSALSTFNIYCLAVVPIITNKMASLMNPEKLPAIFQYIGKICDGGKTMKALIL